MSRQLAEGSIEVDFTAIWMYDGFPGFLYGLATEMRRDGKVYVPSYQSFFSPILLLPADQYSHIKHQVAQLAKIKLEKEQDVARHIEALLRDSLPKTLIQALDKQRGRS